MSTSVVIARAVVDAGKADHTTCTISRTVRGIRIVVVNKLGDQYVAERHDPDEAYALSVTVLASTAAIIGSAGFGSAAVTALGEAWSQARAEIA